MRVGGGGIGPRQEFINIIAGAYMTAIVLSIVGFVLGAILVARQREGHGIWAMVVSTLMAIFWSPVALAIANAL